MGFINKIKNFFYDEEEIDEEVPKGKLQSEKNNKNEKKEKIDNISERELFRSERTFNFPMDVEEDFAPVTDRVKKEQIVKTDTIVEKYTYKPKKKQEVRQPYSYVKPKEKEVKKFKPTPVISPVYGILDENYKADEKLVKNSLEETKEFNMTRKVTFDEIHKKAFEMPKKTIEESALEESKEENKSIFYNLNDDNNNDDEDDDIKITYNDVDYDDEENDEVVIPKISKVKNKNVEEKEADNDILSETKEQDLFNLIDNMYNSEEEEEE